ncbi:ArsR/SmtB family transcription factor [Nocardioides sp.]|jgi:DNA-binding transcriptional ArsR family regulator|uniref:ArsR/SmtB family transcription factor n=1 Tax=Nocardioides sp. TaxID=35761 RepID=UPI002F4178D5
MTRRTAQQRHRDTVPTRPAGQESGGDLLDVLMAFHHPTRRWLAELLEIEGPATVGRLASRTGLAVGSVSHHLKALHRHAFIEPAPDLARDTRESWWRSVRRPLSWSADDFAEGTGGRRIADAAEAENFRHQVRAVGHWLRHSHEVGVDWRRAASATDTVVPATRRQLADLSERLRDTAEGWALECLEDRAASPDEDRLPIRVVLRAFPSGPVRP